jgi:hypothetical protein
MGKLFKILTLSLMGIFFIACSTHKNILIDDNLLGVSMKYELFIKDGKSHQVDSLINADALPAINKWLGTTFADYNTQEKITKRFYVKKTTNGKEVVYIVTGNTEPFVIIKRIKE